MGSIEKRIEDLEGRIKPPEDTEESKWRATRQQYAERLDELARMYRREGETIKNRQAALEEQGYSYRDAQTIAKDEIVRARNPELAKFLDESFPPELRHDPVAKYRWLSDYNDGHRAGRSARA